VAVASCGGLPGMQEERGWGLSYLGHPRRSGLWPHEMVELIAPRALLRSTGREELAVAEGPDQELALAQWLELYAQHIYRLYGAGPQHQFCLFDGTHEFPDRVRISAYDFIERHLES